MIEETGLIVAADEDYAWVEAAASNSCAHCSASAGCGTASLQKWLKRRPNRLRVINDQGVRPGERVVIGIHEQALVRGSFLIYMLPLLALIVGAMLGVYVDGLFGWHQRDLLSIIFGVVAFASSFKLLGRYFAMQPGQHTSYQAVILRRSH